MASIGKVQVSRGIYWVEAPDAGLSVLCGCPADSVKHLMKAGLIRPVESGGVSYETGPNAILLSDVLLQNGQFANLAEFPVLQMLYLQGMLLPGHPGNTGARPLLIGSEDQIRSQMEYIYRGNYGLVSEEEMRDAGMDPDLARDMLRMKLRFAFGRIRPTEDLLDAVAVGSEPVEVRGGVMVRRLALNIFEFSFRGEAVTVDLNLPPHTGYEPPYALPFQNVRRDYFSVVHSGEGDGWDMNRPAMGGVLLFQGRVFLIDAGPNILHTLSALGIGVGEIQGVFHTHAHDDHFCGLATLLRSDRRIRYYAVPWVRASVTKKLAALVGMEERHFADYFDVRDLRHEEWNDVDGLEVRPVFSPHPVETTVLFFRAMGEEGYRTYAHFADIVSLKVLEGMISDDPGKPGVSEILYRKVEADYLTPVDVKKLDVGGGLIHGEAEDFRGDASGRIVLAHTARPFTPAQLEVGSGAAFGSTDVLIPGRQDFLWVYAFHYLSSYFPESSPEQLRMLTNNPMEHFEPGDPLLLRGERTGSLFLLVSGEVRMAHGAACGGHSMLSAGALVGELAAMSGMPSNTSYHAVSHVNALRLPCAQYLLFVSRHGLQRKLADLHERREFLLRTQLFGDAVSHLTLNRVAQAIASHVAEPGQEFDGRDETLYLVRSGALHLLFGEDVLEDLSAGDFFGENCVLYGSPCACRVRALDRAEVYAVPAEMIRDIPIVRWKLFEAHGLRVEKMRNPQLVRAPVFQWREEYRVGVWAMDEQHRDLLRAAEALCRDLAAGEAAEVLAQAFGVFLERMEGHFRDEEELLARHEYPDLARHAAQHDDCVGSMCSFLDRFQRGETGMDDRFLIDLRDWLVQHILDHDLPYGPHLNSPDGL